MPTATPELGLAIATPTDDQPTYLTDTTAAALTLANSMTLIDGLFNDTAGHNHGGAGEGAPIVIAAGAVTPAMIENPWTSAGIVTPTGAGLPPAGSWRLYPHADGQYFKVDSTGVELPIVAPGAIPDPLTIGTLIVTIAATVPTLTQATIATPTTGLPAAGSRQLYPKADGYYYSVDDLGAELPVAAPGAAVIPPVALTGSMHQIGSDMIDQIIAALVTHNIVTDAAVTP